MTSVLLSKTIPEPVLLPGIRRWPSLSRARWSTGPPSSGQFWLGHHTTSPPPFFPAPAHLKRLLSQSRLHQRLMWRCWSSALLSFHLEATAEGVISLIYLSTFSQIYIWCVVNLMQSNVNLHSGKGVMINAIQCIAAQAVDLLDAG